MLEVHEAAKIITESVDPNAKIIFGAVRDDKLKKGEVRVTVIATGFPALGTAAVPRGTPLFTAFGRETAKEEKEADVPPLGTVGKIFNTPTPPAPREEKREEPKVTPPSAPEPIKIKVDEDDDEWGAVPSFLRRPKIK
jgi:cell division protein FtsZ